MASYLSALGLRRNSAIPYIKPMVFHGLTTANITQKEVNTRVVFGTDTAILGYSSIYTQLVPAHNTSFSSRNFHTKTHALRRATKSRRHLWPPEFTASRQPGQPLQPAPTGRSLCTTSSSSSDPVFSDPAPFRGPEISRQYSRHIHGYIPLYQDQRTRKATEMWW